MKLPRSIFVHASLLALSAAFAVSVWTRDKSAKVTVHEATIWNARPSEIERITFEGKGKTITLEPRSDASGKWFFGTITKPAASPSDPPSKTALVSISTGEKLFETLAPLRAIRDAGKLPQERIAELGLETPEATLRVKFASGERVLEIGGTTVGGSDRYARDPQTGGVYVVPGEIGRDFEWAESRLLERELHDWKDADINSAKLIAGGKSREIIRRSVESKSFWADASSPDASDETVANFMQRLDRLRPSEYAESLPEARTVLVRVELSTKTGSRGWVELVKVQGEGDKADYYIASERTRLHGKVVASLAQQVEQDIGSVIR